jgi:hypothetical protein
MSSSKSEKKIVKKTAKKATPLAKDKSPMGSKIGGEAVGALHIRKRAMVHMKVDKICKHTIHTRANDKTTRDMFRLAGTSTSKDHQKLSKIVSKEDAMKAKKELGLKVVECKTQRAKKVKVEKKEKSEKPKVKKAEKEKSEKPKVKKAKNATKAKKPKSD